MLLELWILPVIGYPAKVVFPTPQVVSTLKSIYNIALGLDSWGLTHKILSLPETEGGVSYHCGTMPFFAINITLPILAQR